MMILASEPPMKVRLLTESGRLEICLLIEFSYQGGNCHAERSQPSTILIDKTVCDGCQQKLLTSPMTPAQCRAARALLGITQTQLARAAKLGLSTVVDFEKERRLVSNEAVNAICSALQRAGIEFTDGNGAGEGVLLRKRQKRT
jgi:DNA-binding XRE family transcriptional regulator